MNRRLREVVVVGLVIASLASVIVAAVHADGRTSIRAETNDGGAWLVRRSDGVVGQLNRTAGEVTGVVRVSNPGASFDVEQSGTTILTHDTDTNELQLVDPRTYQIINTVSLAGGVRVRAVDNGAVVWRPEPFTVWALSTDDVAAIVSLDDVTPTIETDGTGLVTTTTDDEIVVLDVANRRVGTSAPMTGPIPDDSWAWTPIGDPEAEAPAPVLVDTVALSAIGNDVLALSGDGRVSRLDDGAAEFVEQPLVAAPNADDDTTDDASGRHSARRTVRTAPAVTITQLAQPSPGGTPLVAVAATGTVLSDAGTADGLAPLDEIGGAEPLAPISHEGCIFTVATAPPTFARTLQRRRRPDRTAHRRRPRGAPDPPRQRLDLDQRPDQRHAVDRRHRHRTGTDRRLGQHPRLRGRRARREPRRPGGRRDRGEPRHRRDPRPGDRRGRRQRTAGGT